MTKANAPKVEEEDDDPERADNRKYATDEPNRLHSLCKGVVGIVISDEAQKVKSELSITHKSVSDLNRDRIILLTATSIISRSLDLTGLLSLFWHEGWEEDRPSDLFTDYYEQAKEPVGGQMLCADNIGKFRWLINSQKYKSWATPDKDTGMLAPSEADNFIPPILSLL